jgi:hypothetical protein
MPPEPLVSIITAVHNGARTIAATLASVDAQTESRWEHLIVDDGSDDETAAIVAAAADTRRCYERQPHGGVSVARNRAIERARGTFLLFLDDDWLLPAGAARAPRPSGGVPVVRSERVRWARLHRRRSADQHVLGPPRTQPAAGMLAGLLLDPGLVAPPLSAMVRASIVAHTTSASRRRSACARTRSSDRDRAARSSSPSTSSRSATAGIPAAQPCARHATRRAQHEQLPPACSPPRTLPTAGTGPRAVSACGVDRGARRPHRRASPTDRLQPPFAACRPPRGRGSSA